MTDLTKIQTPFGFLDGEAQAALRSLPKGDVEMLMGNGEWREVAFPTFSLGHVYRQKENENPGAGHYSAPGPVSGERREQGPVRGHGNLSNRAGMRPARSEEDTK